MSKVISRRTFLRRASLLAGAAAVGPSIVPSSVLGLDGGIAPSNRIGLGFIGQGGRGQGIAPGFLGAGEKAIAVCDVWSTPFSPPAVWPPAPLTASTPKANS
jgi:hypothetical protein